MSSFGAKLPSASANESAREKNVNQDKIEDFEVDSYESKTDVSDKERATKTNQIHVSLKD